MNSYFNACKYKILVRAEYNYAFNNLNFVVNSASLPFLEKRVSGCFFGSGLELAFHNGVFGKFQYIKKKTLIALRYSVNRKKVARLMSASKFRT